MLFMKIYEENFRCLPGEIADGVYVKEISMCHDSSNKRSFLIFFISQAALEDQFGISNRDANPSLLEEKFRSRTEHKLESLKDEGWKKISAKKFHWQPLAKESTRINKNIKQAIMRLKSNSPK